MDLASSNAIDMLSSEKKCPFSKIAGHETAIELQPERNMLSFHVTTMVIARELNQDTNRKEWFTSFKKLLNGKCQRQNSSDVLDFWHSLQTSVKELSKSTMEALLFSFLGAILCEGMKHDGALSIFTILDTFFKTCSSFTASFENDDATDTVMKENIDSKEGNKNLVSVFGLNIGNGPMTEASNAASNNNALCRKEPLSTANQQSSKADLDEDEVCSPFPQQLGKATTETFGTDTASELKRIDDTLMGQGSSTSTEEPTMEGIIQACAVMAHKEKKSEERSKDKKPNKASVFTEKCTIMAESMQACQGTPKKEKKTKETEKDKKPKKGSLSSKKKSIESGKSSHEDTAEKSRKPQKESKVTLPSVANTTSFPDEFQVHGPGEEPNRIETKTQKNGSLSSKKKSLESEKTSHEVNAEKSRKPEKESKVATSPGEEMSLREEMETPISRENKVSETPEKKTYPIKEEADSQTSSNISEKEAMLNELSVPIQAPRNPAPSPILSKPVQEELTELKNEICCLRAELFKTRKKFDEVQDDNQKQIRYHKEMNGKLVEQMQHYIRRLKKFEKLYYSRTNSTL